MDIVFLSKHEGDDSLGKGSLRITQHYSVKLILGTRNINNSHLALLVIVYLNDGNVKEDASEANSDRGSSHDCRSSKEPYGHGERGNRLPTGNDSRLQCHEQTYNSKTQ